MRDRLLQYTIVCSIGVHAAVLGLIGGTSATKPIDVDQLKIVQVNLAKDAQHISIEKPDQPKPLAPKPEPVKHFEPPPVHVPPVTHLKPAPPPKPAAIRRAAASAPGPTAPRPAAGTQPAGDPGGHLNLGSGSERGDLPLESGGTPVGHVPSPVGGEGSGSGTGRGTGSPEPDPNAAPGPGTHTAPQPRPAPPPPPPPPPPKPAEPPPKPVEDTRHVSRLADRAEPELIHDAKVDVPDSVDSDANVTVTYTVDAEGAVTNVKVVESSGNSALDKAVVRAAEKMKYKPAVQDGVPRAVTKRRVYRIRV